MHNLTIQFEPTNITAVITSSEKFPASAWIRISQICSQAEPEARIGLSRIELSWSSALLALLQIGQFRKSLDFEMQAVGEAQTRLREYSRERKIVQDAQKNILKRLSGTEVEALLLINGFTRRRLKDFQLQDVSKLVSLAHGANFSVPGAGKTTVALAVHLLSCDPNTSLVVVAPKNAFSAWEAVVSDCMERGESVDRSASFTRIEDSETTIFEKHARGSRRFLIGYERFVRDATEMSVFLRQVATHVVLDEAHRIKGGDLSLRGRALLSVAPFPIRRDILTGTPAPNSLDDIVPQLEFLWPGSDLSRRALVASKPKEVLSPFYVRTTKNQLGLTPPIRSFVHVEMGQAQLALYSLLRNDVLRNLAGIRSSKTAVEIIAARKSVTRLLQVSTNPLAVIAAISDRELAPERELTQLLSAVVKEGDSNKLKAVVQFCGDCRKRNRKVVVWTIFRHTIARLEKLLEHLGAVSISGDTPTGESSDPTTREGIVKRFHEDANCWVLIANPAACSEGISLHTVCHEALYLDRSYNAAHYLQSIDRIHRLGLPSGVQTNITILQSVAPQAVGSIDHSVSRRLLVKMRTMESILEDQDIRQLALDEEEAAAPIDRDVTLEDLTDLLAQLTVPNIPSEEEQI